MSFDIKLAPATFAAIANGQRTLDVVNRNYGVGDVVSHVPSLKQNRPPDEAEIAKLWTDPVSGQAPPNPFSKAMRNVTEQQWLPKMARRNNDLDQERRIRSNFPLRHPNLNINRQEL
jgi:hypothetical protein